jgi:hypothetical protein
MNLRRLLPTISLIALTAGPLSWFACGGTKPPPETPADETAAASSSAESTAESASAAPAESAAPASTAAAAPAAAETTPSNPAPAAPPPSPSLGSTDCGRCLEKTCAKQATACGKDTDCQSTLDSIHGCSSDRGPAACIDNASAPTAGKPKKLATSFKMCAKSAAKKTCKAKCQ